MIIGIDASRAFVSDKTGTENYSYHVITEMLRLPSAKKHSFVLFIRPNANVPTELSGYTNVIVKIIPLKYLWTQLGLAWETWKYPQINVLWIPAHTLPILRNPGIQTVVTIHGLEYQWLPEYKNLLQKWYLPLSTYYAARAATQLIAVSEFTQNQLLKETHTNKNKIKVIHEGVDTIEPLNHYTIEPILEKFGIANKKYVIFVGSVQPRKNLVALIEAFSRFASGYAGDTESYKLVIAGGIGWMAEEILKSPGRYNVQEKVVFTGRVSDLELQTLYAGAMMYVQPSITEGFGLPVLEAMANGVPVISSDGGALREIVAGAGIVVPLNSQFVAVLADTMSKLSENRSLRDKSIAVGKKRASELNWSKVAKETLNCLVNIGLAH